MSSGPSRAEPRCFCLTAGSNLGRWISNWRLHRHPVDETVSSSSSSGPSTSSAQAPHGAELQRISGKTGRQRSLTILRSWLGSWHAGGPLHPLPRTSKCTGLVSQSAKTALEVSSAATSSDRGWIHPVPQDASLAVPRCSCLYGSYSRRVHRCALRTLSDCWLPSSPCFIR